MSRFYDMFVKIDNYAPERKERVIEACRDEWEFEPDAFDAFRPRACDTPDPLTATGRSSLCGGETESEFADRLAVAVWRANGRFCQVTVAATFLDELPYESHVRDETDYDCWIKKGMANGDNSS